MNKNVIIDMLRREAQVARPTYKAAALYMADLIERDDVEPICRFCGENRNRKSVQSVVVLATGYLYEEHSIKPSMYAR